MIYIVQAVGIRFGFLIEIIVTFISAVTIAFCYSWSLTLVILAFMPLMITAMIYRGFVINGETTSTKKGYEESSYVSYVHSLCFSVISVFNHRLHMRQ